MLLIINVAKKYSKEASSVVTLAIMEYIKKAEKDGVDDDDGSRV